jgi:uncharacterized protein with HEPN domain
MKDDSIYIDHILNSLNRILDYISGKDRESFEADLVTQDAVVRQLEIIGEATKRVSIEFRSKHPDIQWLDMAGMRDVLIHDYIDVDFGVVWKTASEDIPNLKILFLKLQ